MAGPSIGGNIGENGYLFWPLAKAEAEPQKQPRFMAADLRNLTNGGHRLTREVFTSDRITDTYPTAK
ncbi:hypothetical protein D3C78_1647470 [compost metagenome]